MGYEELREPIMNQSNRLMGAEDGSNDLDECYWEWYPINKQSSSDQYTRLLYQCSDINKNGIIDNKSAYAKTVIKMQENGFERTKRGDILPILISIYGSKDVFVSEYRLMLANKLLANLYYDTDKEIQHVELLKLRFGDSTLKQCEIMIRDIEDSKRIHTNIKTNLKNICKSIYINMIEKYKNVQKEDRKKEAKKNNQNNSIHTSNNSPNNDANDMEEIEDGLSTPRENETSLNVNLISNIQPSEEFPLLTDNTNNLLELSPAFTDEQKELLVSIEKFRKNWYEKIDSIESKAFFDASIVSHHFWPTLQEEEMILHPKVQRQMDFYSSAYNVLKNPRQLEFLPQLGIVQLDLVFKRKKDPTRKEMESELIEEEIIRSFTVQAVQANLILFFEDTMEDEEMESDTVNELSLKDKTKRISFSLPELAQKAGLNEEIVARKMMVWVNYGVIEMTSVYLNTQTQEIFSDLHNAEKRIQKGSEPNNKASNSNIKTTRRYTLIEEQNESTSMSENDANGILHMYTGDEDEEGAVSTDAQEAKEMSVYTSYIMGMLTHYGQLSLVRIHNLLRKFVTANDGSDMKYDKTLPQLNTFLTKLCNQEKLECVDGLYLIRK